MAFKKPSVKKVSTDIRNLTIYIRTLKKFGKTTLFANVIQEKYGDPERGLLVGLGSEIGYNLLDNLNSTHIETWQELIELKNWLIKEKGKDHNIEMVAFDVVEELIPIVEKEVIRLSFIDTKKQCKSINAAYGGYGAGGQKVVEMLKDFFLELRKAGFGIWAIGHTKFKTIKEKGSLEEDGYMQLTSNLQSNYEAIFGDVFDCILTGYIDREVAEETVGEGDNARVKRKATGEVRKLYLRGNTLIDAGCRFKDGSVPEYIVFDKPNMAKTFIDVIETGMKGAVDESAVEENYKRNQELGFIPKVSLIQPDEEESEDGYIEIEEDTLLDDPQEELIDVDHNKQLKAKVAGKYKTASADQKKQVKEILGQYGASKLDETKPTQMFEDILAIL